MRNGLRIVYVLIIIFILADISFARTRKQYMGTYPDMVEDEDIENLQQADKFIKEGKIELAVDLYHDALKKCLNKSIDPKRMDEDYQLSLDYKLYMSFADFIEERMSKMPPEFIKLYREKYDVEVKILYEKAKESMDLKEIERISVHYPLSSYAPRCNMTLGFYLFERADFNMSLYYLQKGYSAKNSDVESECLAGIIMSQACLGKNYESNLKTYCKMNPAKNLSNKLEELVKKIESKDFVTEKITSRIRLQPGGNPANNALNICNVKNFSKYWKRNIDESAILNTVNTRYKMDTNVNWEMYYPLYDGKNYYVRIQGLLMCLDPMDGKTIWKLSLGNTQGNIGIVKYRCAPEFSIHEGIIYASGATHLFAINRENGNIIWKSKFYEGKKQEGKQIKFQAYGGPFVYNGKIYIGNNRTIDNSSDTYLQIYDIAKGVFVRETLFCSNTTLLQKEARPPLPVVAKESNIILCNNVGAIINYNCFSDRINWLYTYESQRGLIWNSNPPIIYNNKLILAPTDSLFIYITDLVTGKLLGYFKGQNGVRKPVNQIIGVNKDTLIISGLLLSGIDLRREKDHFSNPLWTVENSFEQWGTACISENYVYVPDKKGFTVFEYTRENAKQVFRYNSSTSNDFPGNMIAHDNFILGASAHQITSFVKPEFMKDELKKKIDNSVASPQNYHQYAYFLNESGSFESAVSAYEKAIEVYKDSPDKVKEVQNEMNSVILGKLSKDMSQEAKISYLKKVEKQSPNKSTSVLVHCKIAEIYEENKNYTDSAKIWHNLAKMNSDIMIEFESCEVSAALYGRERLLLAANTLGKSSAEIIDGSDGTISKEELIKLPPEELWTTYYSYPASEKSSSALAFITKKYIEQNEISRAIHLLVNEMKEHPEVNTCSLLIEAFEAVKSFSLAKYYLEYGKEKWPKQIISEGVTFNDYALDKLKNSNYLNVTSLPQEDKLSLPIFSEPVMTNLKNFCINNISGIPRKGYDGVVFFTPEIRKNSYFMGPYIISAGDMIKKKNLWTRESDFGVSLRWINDQLYLFEKNKLIHIEPDTGNERVTYSRSSCVIQGNFIIVYDQNNMKINKIDLVTDKIVEEINVSSDYKKFQIENKKEGVEYKFIANQLTIHNNNLYIIGNKGLSGKYDFNSKKIKFYVTPTEYLRSYLKSDGKIVFMNESLKEKNKLVINELDPNSGKLNEIRQMKLNGVYINKAFKCYKHGDVILIPSHKGLHTYNIQTNELFPMKVFSGSIIYNSFINDFKTLWTVVNTSKDLVEINTLNKDRTKVTSLAPDKDYTKQILLTKDLGKYTVIAMKQRNSAPYTSYLPDTSYLILYDKVMQKVVMKTYFNGTISRVFEINGHILLQINQNIYKLGMTASE